MKSGMANHEWKENDRPQHLRDDVKILDRKEHWRVR